MLARLEHRGPDDQGEVQVNGSWLGHTRLSIVDVESGHQPLARATRSSSWWATARSTTTSRCASA